MARKVKGRHDEWISLIEVSGPFLSGIVLDSAFPQGLAAHDPEGFKLLRQAYEEWETNNSTRRPDPATHRAWCMNVLAQLLEFPSEVIAQDQALMNIKTTVEQFHETLRPDLAILNPEGLPDAGKPRLLVQIFPHGQRLDKAVKGTRWNASPSTRMTELLRGTRTPLGLITNGEQWMLVHAPVGETATYATWYAHLWLEEKLTLQAFRSLLGSHRFFSVAEDATLEALFLESLNAQEDVANQLGLQVLQAVEVLVQSLDRADQDHERKLLENVTERELYNASLTIMMRLVFMFAAEEHKPPLLPMDREFYVSNYAVSVIMEQLRETADKYGEETLEAKTDAWCRILAVSRMIFGGVFHEDFTLIAYGGDIFNPDKYAFLEGRERGTDWRETQANPLPVNNRTVLHLLEAMQVLQLGGEARRLSFRALDIEQIGSVYEGLLDHEAVRAHEPILGFTGSKDKEPEIALPDLEAEAAKGQAQLNKFLKTATGRSVKAIEKALAKEPDALEIGRLRTACGTASDDLFQRVLPYADLIRSNSFEQPVVIHPGSVYVTSGTDRRSSGTHYTPRSLTEPLVQHTLEPLLYPDIAEGKTREESRRLTVREILDLKVCDLAMGSGAILVQTCRFLGDAIVQLWSDAEEEAKKKGDPPPILTTPFADPATGRVEERPLPEDQEERLVLARRLVVERCLYGVDINPMAVEMAKLSLWLITMARDRPFTFLDHSLKFGDSLLGVIDPRQIETFHLDPERGKDLNYSFVHSSSAAVCHTEMERASEKRKELEGFLVNTPRDAAKKEKLLREANEASQNLRLLGDLLIAAAFTSATAKKKNGFDDLISEWIDLVFEAMDDGFPEEGRNAKLAELKRLALDHQNAGKPDSLPVRRPFHWEVEFPEVFAKGASGFHAIVGNPPFQGGQKITGAVGTDYRNFLVQYLAGEQRGSADLCAYFFLRAASVLRKKGSFGLLSTNTIAQGDTREVGLDQLVDPDKIGASIYRATASRKWPGQANLEVSEVWLRRGKWQGDFTLDGKQVKGITPFLTIPGKAAGNPYRLKANEGKSFIGSYVLGMGFVLTPEEAQAILRQHAGAESGPAFPEIKSAFGKSEPATAQSEPAIGKSKPADAESELTLGKSKSASTESKPAIGESELTFGKCKSAIDECKSASGGSTPVFSALDVENADSARPDYRRVLFPYLNGEDLNSRPDQSPSRWVINFHDWPLERTAEGNWLKTQTEGTKESKALIKKWLQLGRVPADYPDPVAADYPDCLRIVEELVKPERDKNKRKVRREKWWQFAERSPNLYTTIAGMGRVFVAVQTSKYMSLSPCPNEIVYSHMTVVFPLPDYASFAALNASWHTDWIVERCSSLETRLRYIPSDGFDTFPFPKGLLEDGPSRYPELESMGERYHEHRRRIMLERDEGLTKTYNRFHNPDETAPDITELRRLHTEMDQAVAAAYGWTDLDLGHGFHETKQGLRYTVSPEARQEILDRLLELNHARYAEEVKAGLHEKKKGGKKGTSAKKTKAKIQEQTDFFGAKG